MPIVKADAGQLEWRVAAFQSQDAIMMHEIANGIDAHGDSCVRLMELPLTKENRTDAKIFNFRMIYGGSPYAFYMDSKMPDFSKKKWEKIVEDFYGKYKGLHAWQTKNYIEVCRTGQLINPTGRILKFKKKPERGGGWKYSWPEVCNYPVQSLATADIIPLWMVLCSKKLEAYPEVKPIIQVHDEIVYDVPTKLVDKVAEVLYTTCIGLPQAIEQFFGFEFNVPLIAEVAVGDTWGNTKEIKFV